MIRNDSKKLNRKSFNFYHLREQKLFEVNNNNKILPISFILFHLIIHAIYYNYKYLCIIISSIFIINYYEIIVFYL